MKMEKVEIKTKGMHCISCESLIQDAVSNLDGVKNVKADYAREKTTIEFDPTKIGLSEIMEAIKLIGYEPVKK